MIFKVIGRFWSFLTGALGLGVRQLEQKNPEIVYQNAIDDRQKNYIKLKKIAGSVVARVNAVGNEIAADEKLLAEYVADIETAADEDDEETAIAIFQRKQILEQRIEQNQQDYDEAAKNADDIKSSLTEIRSDITSLKAEKDQHIAMLQSAEAKIAMQDELAGITDNTSIKALQEVRQTVKRRAAEAQLGMEIEGQTIDSKIKRLREKNSEKNAREDFRAYIEAKNKKPRALNPAPITNPDIIPAKNNATAKV